LPIPAWTAAVGGHPTGNVIFVAYVVVLLCPPSPPEPPPSVIPELLAPEDPELPPSFAAPLLDPEPLLDVDPLDVELVPELDPLLDAVPPLDVLVPLEPELELPSVPPASFITTLLLLLHAAATARPKPPRYHPKRGLSLCIIAGLLLLTGRPDAS
jgi:hypothetical protein